MVEDIEDYLDKNHLEVSKFVISSTDFDKLDEVQKRAGEIVDLVPLRPMNYCLECIPEGVDKGLGLTKLCEYLGISLTEVMVIGDSDNDLEMIEIAGTKIAMGNAYDCVKTIADHIVSTNDEDGVAEAIERFALSKNKASRCPWRFVFLKKYCVQIIGQNNGLVLFLIVCRID